MVVFFFMLEVVGTMLELLVMVLASSMLVFMLEVVVAMLELLVMLLAFSMLVFLAGSWVGF